MQEVTVKKSDLIKVVKENQEKHNAIFADAVNGFWEKATTSLQEKLAKLEERKPDSLYVSVPYPVSHEKVYISALRQLDMSVHDEIKLSEVEFNQLVMNDWSWKNQFVSSNIGYVTTAAMSGMTLAF